MEVPHNITYPNQLKFMFFYPSGRYLSQVHFPAYDGTRYTYSGLYYCYSTKVLLH